jgi:hypothetical protein
LESQQNGDDQKQDEGGDDDGGKVARVDFHVDELIRLDGWRLCRQRPFPQHSQQSLHPQADAA